jgi:hypothetical protein
MFAAALGTGRTRWRFESDPDGVDEPDGGIDKPGRERMGQALLFTIPLPPTARNRAAQLTAAFWRMCVDEASPPLHLFVL